MVQGEPGAEVLVTNHVEPVHFHPYSPRLNPQEHPWKQGRSAVSHNWFIPKIESVIKNSSIILIETTFSYSLLDFRGK